MQPSGRSGDSTRESPTRCKNQAPSTGLCGQGKKRFDGDVGDFTRPALVQVHIRRPSANIPERAIRAGGNRDFRFRRE